MKKKLYIYIFLDFFDIINYLLQNNLQIFTNFGMPFKNNVIQVFLIFLNSLKTTLKRSKYFKIVSYKKMPIKKIDEPTEHLCCTAEL